jgi:hypothetical protein
MEIMACIVFCVTQVHVTFLNVPVTALEFTEMCVLFDM